MRTLYKPVVQAYAPTPEIREIFTMFKLMVNDCLRLGLEGGEISYEAMKRECYPRMREYDVENSHKASVMFEATNLLRKLASAYNLLREGKAYVVLVEFKDRLSRFGFNYLKSLAENYGASMEVVDGDVKKDEMQELVEDTTSITTILSAKLYDLRSQKFREVPGVVKSAVYG